MKKYFILFFLLISSLTFGQAPFFRIDQIRGSDTTGGGCSDMDSMIVSTTGIVHGINIGQSNNRIQMVLIDKTVDTLTSSKSGIGLFKADQNLPVTLNEGDSINVRGLVTCFNGLSQIVIAQVDLLGSNRPLVNIREVMFLSESTESLVKIKNLEFLPNSWPAAPTGSGFTAKAFRGIPGTTNYIEFDIRIDNDCDLFGAPVPTGKVDVVGIGGQFDSSIPRDSRYQLSPRRATDITPSAPLQLPVVSFSEVSMTLSESSTNIYQVTVEMNNTSNEQISVAVESVDSTTSVGDYTLQSPNLVTFPANTNVVQVFTFNVNSDTLLESDEYFSLRLRKLPGNYTIGSDSIFRVRIAEATLSIKDMESINITPNPISDYSIVKINNVKIDMFKVYNSKGQLEFYSTNNISEEMRKINFLPQGLYKVVFSVGNRNITRTIIKQ